MTDATTREALDRTGAPPHVRDALLALVSELVSVAGPRLAGVVLYGDLAKGRYRGLDRPVNVAVLLADTSVETLDRIAPALRRAWREVRVEPFLLTPDEVRRAADVFPTKLLDVQRHHVPLHGEDPFHDLSVEREHLRLRVEQELRNHALRLRRAYVATGRDPARLRLELGDLVEPLAVALAELLRLRGGEVRDDAPAAVFDQAARALGLDAAALAELATLPARPPDALPGLVGRVLAAATRAADLVDAAPSERP